MFGYIGKMLFVDLSKGATEVREFDERFARTYMGGYGFGAKVLYDEMPAHTDAFAPESMIGFIPGALNGSNAFFAGRYMVVSKSPVTGLWNDSNAGGFFGPMLKKSGYDAVFVKGIAEKPVYLFIDDGKVEIRDAKNIWGKTITAAEEALQEEIGDKKISMAMIGPAGERMSHMAAVINDGHRAAGRGGTGAVMGSKKLKAVVVRGNHKVESYDKKALTELNRIVRDDMTTGPKKAVRATLGTFGTTNDIYASVLTGDASIKNWKSTSVADFPEEMAEKLKSATFEVNYNVKKYSCSACPLGCGATYEIDGTKGKIKEKHAARPEFETMSAFGSGMLNDDPDVIVYCNHLCNEYGYDTISFGSTLSWAMECYDEGILTKDDLNGIDLKWGNKEAIIALTEAICHNEGNAAKLLSNASQYAADQINAGYDFLSVAGGIEIAHHDPRLSPFWIDGYLGDPTPARHTKSLIGGPMKSQPEEVRYNERMTGFPSALVKMREEMTDSAGYCRFSGACMSPETKLASINAVTGFNYSPLEQYLVGLRIHHLRNAFNVREGWVRSDYKIAPRLTTPLPDGPTAGKTFDPDRLIDNFYDVVGLDINGKPKMEMLQFIGGLENVIKDLYGE